MEESQKRKQRLKAIHMGAAQAETACSQNAPPSPGYLVNPLSQPTSTTQAADHSTSSSRFDYYTDPMSAFHGNKRKLSNSKHACSNNLPPPACDNIPGARLPSPFTGPRESCTTPNSATITEVSQSPNLGTPHQIQSPTSRNAPWQSPVGMGTLYTANQYQVNQSPNLGPHGTQSPTSLNTPWRSPIGGGAPWNRATGSSGYVLPYNQSAGYLTSPGSQGCSPGTSSGIGGYGNSCGAQGSSPGLLPGRGKHGNFSRSGNVYSGSSPGAHSGRGRQGNISGKSNVYMYSGRSNSSPYGNSPGSHLGWSRSRQKESQEHVSASDMPHIFYSRAMVQDPWNGLEPVVCDINVHLHGLQLQGRDSPDSWLPKSIAPKETKVTETSGKSSSGLNLAEYLARSFEDAINDAAET